MVARSSRSVVKTSVVKSKCGQVEVWSSRSVVKTSVVKSKCGQHEAWSRRSVVKTKRGQDECGCCGQRYAKTHFLRPNSRENQVT
jgi:hypothetical protein